MIDFNSKPASLQCTSSNVLIDWCVRIMLHHWWMGQTEIWQDKAGYGEGHEVIIGNWEQKVAGDRSLHRSFSPSSFELFQKGTQQVGWGHNTRKAFILIFTGIAIGQIKKAPTVIKFISKYDVPGNCPKGINWTSPIILDIKISSQQ